MMDQTYEQQKNDEERGVQPPEQPKKFAVKNGLKLFRDAPTAKGRAGAERSARKQNEAEQRRAGCVSTAAVTNAATPEVAVAHATTATTATTATQGHGSSKPPRGRLSSVGSPEEHGQETLVHPRCHQGSERPRADTAGSDVTDSHLHDFPRLVGHFLLSIAEAHLSGQDDFLTWDAGLRSAVGLSMVMVVHLSAREGHSSDKSGQKVHGSQLGCLHIRGPPQRGVVHTSLTLSPVGRGAPPADLCIGELVGCVLPVTACAMFSMLLSIVHKTFQEFLQ